MADFPAYVPGVLYALAKQRPFGSMGFVYTLSHPDLRFEISAVEQAIHEVAHFVLLFDGDSYDWQFGAVDISTLRSSEIRSVLAKRNDRCTQEAVTLAVESWILRHWGFSGVDSWLPQVVKDQPRQVTVQRVTYHLTHPVKRRYVVAQAHRVMQLIRLSVKNWRKRWSLEKKALTVL